MASGYTPTNETANFGKFARIILDLCRDAVFQILSKEIPAADLPSKIWVNLHNLKQLSPEQLNKIRSKPAGVSPCSTDFDITAIYTLIRNICPGISVPAQGWGYPPQPSDTQVSDDVERIRQKRNALFGHAYTAALSDTDFNNELAEIRRIISRLDNYLGQNFMSGLSDIEASSMDPDMQLRYSERCQQLLKQDHETREQLGVLMDQHMGAQIRQEETIELLQELQSKQAVVQIRQEETDAFVKELQSKQAAGELRQDEAIELLYERQNKQEERLGNLQDSRDQQTAEQLKQKEAIEMLRGKVDALSLKDDETQAHRCQKGDEMKIQNHLRQVYQEEKRPEVSIIPTYDDVPLSSVFTPVVIREDLESAFNLKAKQFGESMPPHSGLSSQTGKVIQSYKQMFYKDGTLQKNVYLLGKAGSGKTTFCNHLVDLWCPSSTTAHYKNQEMITEFEFIFFVTCRDAEQSQKVIDMVLDQLFSTEIEYHSLVKHVLRTKPEKCLIIIDGLDEWAGSPSRSTGPRTPSGLPDRRGLENCVFLTTSRPWRIEALRQGIGKSYRIMEIQGLTAENVRSIADKSVKALNENKMNADVSLTDFLSAVEKAKLTQIVTNPLMLLVLLASWHDRRSLDISQCVNYAGLMESLFLHAEGRSRRTDAKDRLTDLPELPGLKAEWARSNAILPKCFSGLHFCKIYAQLISKVSELAFNGLFHEMREKSLVFSDSELGNYLKTSELDVCCRIGILSLSQARSKSRERVKTVSFLHKTLQEFLAAFRMTGDSYDDCLTVFKKHCKCVADVLDLGVFLVFLCGMSPEKGREVWRYIGELTTSDPAVQKYRAEIGKPFQYISSSQSVPRLQQLLLQCTAEAMHHRPDMPPNCLIQAYNIQDVYVDSETSMESLKLLLGHAVAIENGIKTLVMFLIEPSQKLLETINCMSSLESLAIQSPPRQSDPKQLYEVIFTALKSVSPVTLLKLTHMSIEVPNRSFTVQLPHMLKSMALWKVSITGRISWAVALAKLYMRHVTLDHDSVLQLATWLQGSSSLQELCIRELKCRGCGRRCKYQLDITRHTRLNRLKVWGLSVDRLHVPPSNLETVELWSLYKRGSVGSVLSSLHPAPQLTELTVSNCKLSQGDISTLCSVLPQLPQLVKLVLRDIRCNDLGVCVSSDMSRLTEIWMADVTMSDQAWSRFAGSLPPTSHQLTVELWRVNIDAATRSYIAAHFTVTRDDVTILGSNGRDLFFNCGARL